MRHRGLIAVALALSIVAGSAYAAIHQRTEGRSAPPGSAESAGSAAGPELPTADRKRIAAIQQYQRDLVSVIALRSDPQYLLGAAILSRSFRNEIPGLDFDALIRRAAAAPGAGPATRWARLGECETRSDCPNAEAFAYLEKHAGSNAAVWIVAMDTAAEHGNAKGERAALEKAAAADVFDDYYGQALAAVAKAVAVLPPLADTTQGARGGQPDSADGVRVLVALTGAQTHIRPKFDPLLKLCGKRSVTRDAGVKPDCLKLAHTLQWGSSPVARAAGLRIQAGLEPARKSQDEQANRDLAWQVNRYSDVLKNALTDPALASRWLAAARNGGTELSLIFATLRASGVPLEAPEAGAGKGPP